MASEDRVPYLSLAASNPAEFTGRVIWDDPGPKTVQTGLLWPDGTPITKTLWPTAVGFIDWDATR